MPSSAHDAALGLPLTITLFMIPLTVLIHAFALMGIVHFMRRQHRLGRTGIRFWQDVAIVCVATLLMGAAHLVESAIWALLFMYCGEFARFDPAFYHSAMNYTTLGYGDVVMSPSWKIFGPLEAADGMLMFGVSTAMIFAVIQALIQIKFPDART